MSRKIVSSKLKGLKTTVNKPNYYTDEDISLFIKSINTILTELKLPYEISLKEFKIFYLCICNFLIKGNKQSRKLKLISKETDKRIITKEKNYNNLYKFLLSFHYLAKKEKNLLNSFFLLILKLFNSELLISDEILDYFLVHLNYCLNDIRNEKFNITEIIENSLIVIKYLNKFLNFASKKKNNVFEEKIKLIIANIFELISNENNPTIIYNLRKEPKILKIIKLTQNKILSDELKNYILEKLCCIYTKNFSYEIYN